MENDGGRRLGYLESTSIAKTLGCAQEIGPSGERKHFIPKLVYPSLIPHETTLAKCATTELMDLLREKFAEIPDKERRRKLKVPKPILSKELVDDSDDDHYSESDNEDEDGSEDGSEDS